MSLTAIVAMDPNRVIGRDGQLPWHLPEDLKTFKKLTTGNPIIMGRTTYESIGRPLPNRRNIVVSTTMSDAPNGTELAASPEAALELVDPELSAFVIGGSALYSAMLPMCDGVYISHVHDCYDGDAWFPEIDQWFVKDRVVEKHDSFDLVYYRKKA